MKVCIVGAGAIGGWLATRLVLSGRASVSVLARGATLQALRRDGWIAYSADKTIRAPAIASDRAEDLGVSDLVIIAVKGHALPSLAPSLIPLIGPETVLLPAMNGVPWWFCDGLAGFDGQPLDCVDPGGGIARALPSAQVVGCVVHISCSTLGPGQVQHRMGQELIVGEPSGRPSDRARSVAALLCGAGFEATLSTDVRRAIWYKLWGNMTMNPVSALTGATIDHLLGDPLVRTFCSQAMREAAAVGDRIGCPIDQTPDDRHAVTARLGAFKTSMLQDVEAGRPIELDAIIGAVREIAQRVGIATPGIDALLGLTRLMARVRGLYPP